MGRTTRVLAAASSAAVLLLLAGCTFPSSPSASSNPGVPDAIQAIMDKPVYKKADWSMLAFDLTTGKTIASKHANTMAFTGSTRKLFSVGAALETLGADHTTTTGVYRSGSVDGSGVLTGNLVFVGAGDLTLGGRRTADDGIAFENFDHNDANNLGTAGLTPQDPLAGLDALAKQVRESGITRINGNVTVDDRLFTSYRVPNQQLLITPTMLNENMVDVTVTPTQPGKPAIVDYRPKTSGFSVTGSVMTTAAGTDPTVAIPDGTTPNGSEVTGVVDCVGTPSCTGTISGTIPVDYSAPLSGDHQFVGTFRIDNPENFARTAFIDALGRAGVSVSADAVGANPSVTLPAESAYTDQTRVAAYTSPPFSAQAKLILKVSLNLGANLALTQFGLAKGENTVSGALAAERKELIARGIPGNSFDFPTNGSGSPDSKATPRAIVDMLTSMNDTSVSAQYRDALPVLGVDGSLAGTGTKLPAKGHVHGKTGTTVSDGKLVAQNLAGYVDARNGHRIAYAIVLNNYGTLKSISDVSAVLEDEAAIANVLYERD
jgi:D-alanyl-D-alanine carboxypeptidase/D-alanyl-D-alanine-endopeptidase (penicillin-binding protein 4)